MECTSARSCLGALFGGSESEAVIGMSTSPFQIFDVMALLTSIINFAIYLGAIVMFLCIIVSGLQWMFAGGNSQVSSTARSRVLNCITGFAILAISYAIVLLVQYFLGIEIFRMGPNNGGPDTPPTAAPSEPAQACAAECDARVAEYDGATCSSSCVGVSMGRLSCNLGEECCCGAVSRPDDPDGPVDPDDPDGPNDPTNPPEPGPDGATVDYTMACVGNTNDVLTDYPYPLENLDPTNDYCSRAAGCDGGAFYSSGEDKALYVADAVNAPWSDASYMAASAWIYVEPCTRSSGESANDVFLDNAYFSFQVRHGRCSDDTFRIRVKGNNYIEFNGVYDANLQTVLQTDTLYDHYEWIHVGASYNDGVLKMFVNGQLMAEDSEWKRKMPGDSPFDRDDGTSSCATGIGMPCYPGGGWDNFSGYIDEVWLYADYTNPVPDEYMTGLVNTCTPTGP